MKMLDTITTIRDVYEIAYTKNLGFIIATGQEFGVPTSDYDDFLQLGYLAVRSAVDSYSYRAKYHFISYLKMWLRFYYFRHSLLMHYPFRITKNYYSRLRLSDSLQELQAVNYEFCMSSVVTERHLRCAFEVLAYQELRDVLWREVKSLLSAKKYDMVRLRFVKNYTYAQIGAKYGIGKEAVRKALDRIYAILRKNQVIRDLAADYFNIGR